MSDSVWRPITKADVGKKMLVTNNLMARNAFGDMSHCWLVYVHKADQPKVTGKYHAYPVNAHGD